MTSMNPLHYLRNAWNATHSGWGKLTIVFFYVFIWFQILWALELIIWPKKGWECWYAVMDEYMAASMVTVMRSLQIFCIGFYLYADRGGIKVWNVAMVFLVNGVWSWVMLKHFGAYKSANFDGAPQDCGNLVSNVTTSLWVLFVWSLVALLAAIMEQCAAPAGTSGERAPLNV